MSDDYGLHQMKTRNSPSQDQLKVFKIKKYSKFRCRSSSFLHHSGELNPDWTEEKKNQHLHSTF